MKGGKARKKLWMGVRGNIENNRGEDGNGE